MGKQARLKQARRLAGPDPHLPDVVGPVAEGVLDPRTMRAAIPRRADFWRALPGRRVGCDLCYRRCELAPGEAGWCGLRRNDGGALRLAAHGVIGTAAPHLADVAAWRSNSRMVWVAGVGCTSACSFCTSTDLALAPARLPWASGGERRPGPADGWAYHRGMLHPAAVLDMARRWGCSGVYFGIGEPTLTYEFTLDTARLATAAGLFTCLDTNAFTAPAAIAALAPFVGMAYLGLKGGLDPEFYARRMRAGGAVPHVLAAAEAWRDSPTHLVLADVVAPPHWCDDATATGHMRRTYTWIAEALGPTTPLELRGMVRPRRSYDQGVAPLLPRDATDDDARRFLDRLHLAEAVAAECGLVYVYTHERREVRCHHCGGRLVGGVGRPDFALHVGPDGICGHCGGPTPIVGLARDEYDALRREAAATVD